MQFALTIWHVRTPYDMSWICPSSSPRNRLSFLPISTGHSRLVIGVEEHSGKDGGLFLLLFDPSHSTKQMHSLLDDIQTSSSGLRHLRRSLKQMRCKQYQIVYVDGIMDAQEMERSKILNSVRVP